APPLLPPDICGDYAQDWDFCWGAPRFSDTRNDRGGSAENRHGLTPQEVGPLGGPGGARPTKISWWPRCTGEAPQPGPAFQTRRDPQAGLVGREQPRCVEEPLHMLAVMFRFGAGGIGSLPLLLGFVPALVGKVRLIVSKVALAIGNLPEAVHFRSGLLLI